MYYLTRTVWILSLVSLLTDAASEMLYPVMPLYLKSIGFSVLFIGILEGVSEAVAGLSKGYFGRLSDVLGRRAVFVQIGYSLSAVAKPLIIFYTHPLWVLFVRTADRLGKGLRTAPRDALLSGEATEKNKAKVFGFHRSFDTLGAVVGPLVALLFLYFFPQQYNMLFLLAFIPGAGAVVLSLLLRDKKVSRPTHIKRVSFFSFLRYWKEAVTEYKRVVAGLLVFALFNSSDVFLLLKVKEAGLSDNLMIALYIFYNLSYALSAFPLGIIADRWGLKLVLIIGLFLFSVVYCGMALSSHLAFFLVLFFLYGIHAAATESVAKAWIARLSPEKDTGTAIGVYSALQSLLLMLASWLTGFLWVQFNPAVALLISSVAALLVICYFIACVR